MNPTRVPGVPRENANPFARAAYWYARRRFGSVPEPVRVAAQHAGVLGAMGAFETFVERWRRVDDHLKELAWMKVATMVGCRWCTDFGTAVAEHKGITEQQLADLHRYAESDAFDELEKLVLRYAEAMTETPLAVTDELVEELRHRMDDAQVVELTAAIAWEDWRARFNHALGIGSQGFARREVCVLPN